MEPKNGKAVVTGVAGFIGSHLAERLIALGYQVIGVDCFTDFYPRTLKEANLANLRYAPGFSFVEGDIRHLDWATLLNGADYLFHEAAQAGVRDSWGDGFSPYVRHNIQATQRLLEAAKGVDTLKRFVFASSSSVYGDAEAFPTSEDTVPRPVSPYGVTKLTCEHLCDVYHRSFGVPVVMLRYFTVYGPRQRPDMAFHRFIKAVLSQREIVVYGDGRQTRDFTFVSDIVAANIRAMAHGVVDSCVADSRVNGQVFNIGGGARIELNEVIKILEDVIGLRARVTHASKQQGDARHTSADISKAREWLGYEPHVRIDEGLREEVEWLVRSETSAAALKAANR